MSTQRTRYFLASVILAVLLAGGLILVAQSQVASQDIAGSSREQGSHAASTAPRSIPPGYKTGLWPTYPITTPIVTDTQAALLVEPRVSMTGDWTAQIEFTTTIPTPASRVYFGSYEPDPLLPRPRFLKSVGEELEGSSCQHSVELDISKLLSEQDINDMADKGGGLIVYRIEVYQVYTRSVSFDLPSSAHFYDGRFEFYDGQIAPTVVQGPFVDQTSAHSAIVSWDTDLPVDGVVRVQGVGDFYAPNSNDTHFEVALTGLAAGNTYTYSVRYTHGTGTLSTRQYSFHTPEQDAGQFTFAVLGDSHASYGGGEYNLNGVNARVLRSLSAYAFNRGAEFIVHTGDMINGYTNDMTDFELQLEAFKGAVESVGHYIPIYETMGNHEALLNTFGAGSPPLDFDKEGNKSAEAIFAHEFVNPTNGPQPDNVAANAPPGKALPPYTENVYYFDYGNSRFVVLNNNYWYSSQPEAYGGNLKGYVLDDQLAWLTEVFSQTKSDDSLEHLFLFAQEPLFPNSEHVRDGMWYNGGDPAQNDGWDRAYVSQRRDEIWSAFVGTGKAVAGNFGGEHNYSRTFITQDRNGADLEHPAWQIISGGAGAPFTTQVTNTPWISNVEQFSTQMHYTLLRVDGQQVRLEVYNVNDRLLESVILKTSGGTLAVPGIQVAALASRPLFSSPTAAPMASLSPEYGAAPALREVPANYETGKWPTYPVTNVITTSYSDLFMDGEPVVTMTGDWTAHIEFTTTISAPAARVHYGVYEPDALLPWPRFVESVRETLPGTLTETQQHGVTLDLGKLIDPGRFHDVNDMQARGGGLVVYRIELYQSSAIHPLYDTSGAVRFYDRRFEFYAGQIAPTVVQGPFVDQISASSAIVSWDTDLPVDGSVRVPGLGDFNAPNSNDTHFEVALTGLAAGSAYTYTVLLDDGGAALLSTRQYVFRTPAQDTTQFTFALLGDSRASFGGGEYDFNSVNARVLKSLTTGAFNQGAAFIVHTGDMVDGYTTDVLDFEMELESCKDAVENVAHYIPIYELMGNHEALANAYYDYVDKRSIPFDKEGDESAEAIFANEFVNPTNGPQPDNVAANTPPGESLPPYTESAYYFDYGNSRFVMLNNNYWWSMYPEEFGGNLEGYVLDDQLAWLTEVFSQTKTDDSLEHLFLFAHEPFFPNSNHVKDGMWYNGGDPAQNDGWDRTYVVERRDEIWSAFVGTGKAVSGNFSDEHNYSRTFITQNRNGADFERPTWQIISGGAGAPGSVQVTGLPWSAGVQKSSTQTHYTLFKVNGSTVTLEVYNIDGELIDSANLTQSLGVTYDLYLPVLVRSPGG